MSEYTLIFIFKKIWNLFFVLFKSESFLTAVSWNKLAVTRKFIYREQTMVYTSLTSRHWCFKTKLIYFFKWKHCAFLSRISVFCDKCCTESTHDTCYVRSYRFTAWYTLKTSEYGIIVESTALNDYLFSEVFRVCKFDNFKQCIFDNGVCKSGWNVGNTCSLFLCLLDFWVHKYRASWTEVDRIFGK